MQSRFDQNFSRPGQGRTRPVTPRQDPDRARAALTALLLFLAACSLLGGLGFLLVEDPKVAGIFAVSVLGFSAWIARETYRNSVRPLETSWSRK